MFDHDQAIKRQPRDQWKTHALVDPKQVAGTDSPHAGQVMRECYDNDEHPETKAIAVIFDVTSSMGTIPRVLQEKLPALHGLLLRKGYVEHPEIMFGAIGDGYSDRLVLQVGQFESDNRMDENLEALVLEGGGGGQTRESYGLAAYFVWKHTDIDCWNKRGEKGYLFTMGDEMPYPMTDRGHIERFIGDTPETDPSMEEIVAGVTERYEWFHLFVADGSYRKDQILPEWSKYLGERALVLNDSAGVCETIALTIGLTENAVSYDDGMADLADVSTDASATAAAGKALATIGAGTAAVATATGDLPATTDDAGDVDRL